MEEPVVSRGHQASDPLGPGAVIFLTAFVAAELVVPGILVFHLLTGNAEEAGDRALGAIVCLLIALLLLGPEGVGKRRPRGGHRLFTCRWPERHRHRVE